INAVVRLVRASPHLSRPIPLMRAAISHFRVILGSRNTLNSGGTVFDHHCFGLVFYIFFHFAIPLLAKSGREQSDFIRGAA
ncbi:MAG: hypothetical protein WBX25_19060, partial [Rhodomicrobium sp.]